MTSDERGPDRGILAKAPIHLARQNGPKSVHTAEVAVRGRSVRSIPVAPTPETPAKGSRGTHACSYGRVPRNGTTSSNRPSSAIRPMPVPPYVAPSGVGSGSPLGLRYSHSQRSHGPCC
mgnify:CR=1 FL=1